MGNCSSNDVASSVFVPSQNNQNTFSFAENPNSQVQGSSSNQMPIIRNPFTKKFPISSQTEILAKSILNKFSIAQQILSMLSGICFTENQAKDLSKALIHGVISLQQKESSEQTEIIKTLFNKDTIQMIAEQRLFYYGVLDKLGSKKISQSSESRIYHTIANIKKGTKIDKKWKNQYRIQCIKSNDYKELSKSELQQVIKYESIAKKTLQIGQRIGFKFQSMKKQSEKIVSLLTECIQKHIHTFDQMKYDLNQSEVMIMAQISRQACDYYDNGVFILLVYLVQSSKRLQKESKSPQEIEKLLKRCIEDISKKYPPGEGLSNEHQELIKKLKDLQNPKNYNKAGFSHQSIRLTSTNKQLQVEEIITKYAIIAEQSKQQFEELVKATCLAKCVYFKIGLKYYPSKPNEKALTRIKEKMFFKKESTQEKRISGKDIKEVLEKQQTNYKSKIDSILDTIDSVQFKITDMVRGKCVFLEIGDIIESVNEIKKFVANDPHFGIQEIESRFTNKVPISDVTLKIVLNNRIVAELQLTIQTNAATYNFAHKIYELQRSKVFSKLKITHNYFEESKDDFSELVKKALQLQDSQASLSPSVRKSIEEYFKLGEDSRPFNTVLEETIEDSRESLNNLVVSVDPLLQDLLIVAFGVSIGRWGKAIGKIIDKSLKNNDLSPKLKSVILSTLFEKFQLCNQSQSMQQLFILQWQMKTKIYIEEYFKEYFCIESAMKYANQNQRSHCRSQQLSQIVFFKQLQSSPIQLNNTIFVQNLVIEEHCFEKIKKLQQFINFYFITKQQSNSKYQKFSCYTMWIQDEFIHNSKSIDSEMLKNQVEIVRAQKRLQNNQINEASESLSNSLKIFKNREEHTKAMHCEILLAQCTIKANEMQPIQKFIDEYRKNVIQKALILGLQLKGQLYADSLWRISEYFWQRVQTNEELILLLESFTAMAIEQMSRSKGVQLIYLLCKAWKHYDMNNLKKPLIKENPKMKYASLSGFGQISQLVSMALWRNLTTLYFSTNNIGHAGCEYLSKADWKHITILTLNYNNIGPIGCLHLSKADWKNLSTLQLNFNAIGDEGCQYLSKADWKNLTTLHLTNNSIGPAGCEYLSKTIWKNISSLYLNQNQIGDGGCEHLSRAEWINIKTLILSSNKIGDVGCQHLTMGKWSRIKNLYLNYNCIKDTGCIIQLSKADWKHLKLLDLRSNLITLDEQSVIKLFARQNVKIDI